MAEEAVLDWVNTFELVSTCQSFSNLSSGHVIGLMLSEMYDHLLYGDNI